MKKVRLLSLLLALVTVLLSFAACNVKKGVDDSETTVTGDSYANHITVNIMVYAATELNKATGLYTKTENVPIIGAPKGLSVGYNNGETVSAAMVLERLAAERKAKLTFASGKSIDVIEFGTDKYFATSIINRNRTGTARRDPSDQKEVPKPIYYKDMIIWEWKINDKAVSSIGSVEIKDGDSLVLTLVLDYETQGQNYVFAEDVDTTAAEGTTSAEPESND